MQTFKNICIHNKVIVSNELSEMHWAIMHDKTAEYYGGPEAHSRLHIGNSNPESPIS